MWREVAHLGVDYPAYTMVTHQDQLIIILNVWDLSLKVNVATVSHSHGNTFWEAEDSLLVLLTAGLELETFQHFENWVF